MNWRDKEFAKLKRLRSIEWDRYFIYKPRKRRRKRK